MDSQTSEIDSEEAKRQSEIDEIVAKDKAAFEKWIADNPNTPPNLSLPNEVLRYLLLSRRSLELADDPNAVRVVTLPQTSPTYLTALIVERKPYAVMEEEVLKKIFRGN